MEIFTVFIILTNPANENFAGYYRQYLKNQNLMGKVYIGTTAESVVKEFLKEFEVICETTTTSKKQIKKLTLEKS